MDCGSPSRSSCPPQLRPSGERFRSHPAGWAHLVNTSPFELAIRLPVTFAVSSPVLVNETGYAKSVRRASLLHLAPPYDDNLSLAGRLELPRSSNVSRLHHAAQGQRV